MTPTPPVVTMADQLAATAREAESRRLTNRQIAAEFRSTRKFLGLTQLDAARLFGYTSIHPISDIERGISLRVPRNIAEILLDRAIRALNTHGQ